MVDKYLYSKSMTRNKEQILQTPAAARINFCYYQTNREISLNWKQTQLQCHLLNSYGAYNQRKWTISITLKQWIECKRRGLFIQQVVKTRTFSRLRLMGKIASPMKSKLFGISLLLNEPIYCQLFVSETN